MTYRIPQVLAIAALAAVFCLPAATSAPPSSTPLTSVQLRGIAGLDRASHMTGTQTCEEKSAAQYNSPTVVAASGCTAANSVRSSTNCILCGPYEGNPIEILIGPGPSETGTRYGVTNSCGSRIIGVCQMINGEPACGNQTITSELCSTVSEYWNQ